MKKVLFGVIGGLCILGLTLSAGAQTSSQSGTTGSQQPGMSGSQQPGVTGTQPGSTDTMGSQQPRVTGTQPGTMETNLSQQEVRQLQERLRAEGFDPGPIDSIWGPQTQEALRQFQEQQGLDVTGELDESSREALGIEGGGMGTGGAMQQQQQKGSSQKKQ